MRFDILTLFPDMCESVVSESILGRAREKGLVEINCRNIRKYTLDKHRRVDDAPYGGGSGMLIQAQPVYDCYRSLCEDIGRKPHLIYLSPQGAVLTQQRAKELLQFDNIALLCGHYEGIDERVLEEIVDEEISIGDYVLTGGELPAIIVADCVCRMLPGVLSGEDSFTKESHYASLLEEPQYTRPEVWHDKSVPEVLLSGHHANIQSWRRQQQLERTLQKRPDLLEKADLDKKDRDYLKKLTEEETE